MLLEDAIEVQVQTRVNIKCLHSQSVWSFYTSVYFTFNLAPSTGHSLNVYNTSVFDNIPAKVVYECLLVPLQPTVTHNTISVYVGGHEYVSLGSIISSSALLNLTVNHMQEGST